MAGVVGYALPIRDGTSKVVAAVHVSVLSTRATKMHERKILTEARACVDQIDKQLGHEHRGTRRKAST
jgi:DNA-binding IclR family transcriptional regulator